jgi:Rrf2 family transcriptional regulator, nitric oxide-sensitive transcriptional repressor
MTFVSFYFEIFVYLILPINFWIMQLSKFTDYSFRVLLLLAVKESDKLYTAENLAVNLNTSEHHLKKVIQKLAKKGYLNAIKGRNGGIQLARPAHEINLGDVLLDMEENMNIVGCFANGDECPFDSMGCRLKRVVKEAAAAFVMQFSEKTLADIALEK